MLYKLEIEDEYRKFTSTLFRGTISYPVLGIKINLLTKTSRTNMAWEVSFRLIITYIKFNHQVTKIIYEISILQWMRFF